MEEKKRERKRLVCDVILYVMVKNVPLSTGSAQCRCSHHQAGAFLALQQKLSGEPWYDPHPNKIFD